MRMTALLVLMLCGCLGVDRLVMYGALAAAGAPLRNDGECYSACNPGTVCNGDSGFCEAMACHGRCRPSEVCVNDGTFTEHCEPR